MTLPLSRCTKKHAVLVGVVLLMFVVVGIGLGTGLQTSADKTRHAVLLPDSFDQFEAGSNEGPGGRGWGSVGVSDSILGSYQHAAISSDAVPCATIARNILLRNGTAADATIAGMFCVGVINSQSAGLGGGFLLTYYSKAERKAYALDARETAPGAATQDMYGGDSTKSRIGGLAIATPGELRGYRALYERFGGGLPWTELVAPAIKLCDEGHRINWHMARALQYRIKTIMNEPSMRIFINPATGGVYKEGDVLKRPVLAATLRVIQRDPDALYTGALARPFLQDLRSLGSIIDAQDLINYRATWRKPVEIYLSNGNYTLYSVPPPGSGLILAFILNILDGFYITREHFFANAMGTTHQRMIEAFKYAYARRTELGDEDFVDMKQLLSDLTSDRYARATRRNMSDTMTYKDYRHYGATTSTPDDHGTAHFSLIAENGDAVSITSTVNLYMGAGVMSTSTGLVLNDEMDDFSAPKFNNFFGIPPSSANFISPGKRPLSSMSPVVVVDRMGAVRVVAGAAGGTKIPSALASVLLRHLWKKEDIKRAVDARRLHHQLFPMTIMAEKGFDELVLAHLRLIGHPVQEFDVGGSVVCAVAVKRSTRSGHGNITANADFRKSGQVDGY